MCLFCFEPLQRSRVYFAFVTLFPIVDDFHTQTDTHDSIV